MIASLLWYNKNDKIGQMIDSHTGKIYFITVQTELENAIYLIPGALADIELAPYAFSANIVKASFNYGARRSEIKSA